MIQQSKYNIIIPNNRGIYVYNTLSGAIIAIKDISIFENSKYRKLLLEEGFITEEENELNLYKFKYYKRMFNNNYLNLYIVPTMCCNLSCRYCFEGPKKNGVMEQKTIESIIKFLSKSQDKKISITWFGGEPLLAFPIIEDIRNKLMIANIEYSSTLITNGTLLTKNIRKQISTAKLDFIQITLDGNKEQHDSIRFFKNNQGTYDIIIENLKGVLQETNINVNIQVNIDENNFMNYESVFLMLCTLFPEEINSRRLQIGCNRVRNRTDFDSCNSCISEQRYFDVVKYFANLQSQAKRSIALPKICFPCMMHCTNTFVIGPDGNIYKCLEHIDKKGTEIGNINNLSMSKKKIAQYTFAHSPFDDPECIKCKMLPICGGGCPLDREKKEKGLIDSTCPYIKENISEIINLVIHEK